MAVIVQKYGGSSVETIEKMRKIAERVILEKKRGHSLVVVVSAMGKTTNQLIQIARSVTENPNKRELDMLVSTGEQVSISLLAMILQSAGYDSVSLTGFQAGIQTEGIHTKNRIIDIDVKRIQKYLNQGKIVIVAGFQGINTAGDITTLGRGGSDTTAVALAAKLQTRCEIYTDVDGIYAVDPRIYAGAKKLDAVFYEEMMEMASLGAKVMEPRAVEIGQKYKVPIYVAASHKTTRGTYIKERDETMEQKGVTGITVSDHVAMITVNHVPYMVQNIALIFERLGRQDVNLDMISQTPPTAGFVNLSFTASQEDELVIDQIMADLEKEMPTIQVVKDLEISKISVVGIGMRNLSGVAARVFKLFANHQIEFKQVTTSEISISYTISIQDQEKAVRILAEAFDL